MCIRHYQIQLVPETALLLEELNASISIPFGGWRIVPHYHYSKQHAMVLGHGLTAEAVAEEFRVTREMQDDLLTSHI